MFKVHSQKKNKSIVSATSVLSQQPNPMAHNTTASKNKLTCIDHVLSGKCNDRLVQKRLACKSQMFREV